MSQKDSNKSYKTSHLPAQFLLSLLITANLCMFGPLQAVVSNIDLYFIDFNSLAALLLKTGAITWVILFLIINIGSRISSFIPILFLALAVGLWVQGNFFLWDYGTVFGKAFNFSINFRNGLYEVGFWVLLFIVFIKYRSRLAAYTLHISIFLIVLQGVDLGIKYQTQFSALQQVPINMSKAFEFSKKQNAIVIILDSFQGDDLEEAMRRASLGSEDFKGFVHFRNAVAQYPHTSLSIPSLLSSQRFPVETYKKYMEVSGDRNWSQPAADWAARISTRSSMYLAAKGGVSVDVITRQPFMYGRAWEKVGYRNTATSELLKEAGITDSSHDESINLLSISLFRHSPHFLKKYVYNDGDWILSGSLWGEKQTDIHVYTREDILLLKQLTYKAVTSDVPSTYKVLHFWTPHIPHDADENCKYNEMPKKIERRPDLPKDFLKNAMLGSSACILRHLAPFLKRLDTLGVYDNSLILIVGDHGNKQSVKYIDTSKLDARVEETDNSNNSSRVSPTDMEIDFSMGVPLFMVKPPLGEGVLKVSDAPVMLCDVPATIFEYLKKRHSFNCKSVFQIAEDEKRTRIYYKPIRPPKMDKYLIKGHSWYESSWSYDGRH